MAGVSSEMPYKVLSLMGFLGVFWHLMAHLFQPHDRKDKVSKITHWIDVLGTCHFKIQLYPHFTLQWNSKFLRENRY